MEGLNDKLKNSKEEKPISEKTFSKNKKKVILYNDFEKDVEEFELAIPPQNSSLRNTSKKLVEEKDQNLLGIFYK